MKRISLTLILAAVLLLVSACGRVSTPLAIEIQPTSTNTLAPTSTALPTSTPKPTSTPTATSTPGPVAVVVTSIPSGIPHRVQIADRIGGDHQSLDVSQNLWFERVVWVRDIKVEYGGGKILLSGSPKGNRPLIVDDLLIIKILHENGIADTFEHDFSGPYEAGPFDLTAFFHEGVNMLYVTIYDYGYSAWGTPGLWLIEFR